MARLAPAPNFLNLSEVMHSGKYSDLTFVCAGKEFRVHKVVVCTQSDVLSAAVDGSFKEAKTSVIAMNAFKIEAVEHMIEFMYTGEYGAKCPCGASFSCRDPCAAYIWKRHGKDENGEPLTDEGSLHHVWVNAIADYYNITRLAERTRYNIQYAFPYLMNIAEWTAVTKEALELTGNEGFHDKLAQLATPHIARFLAEGTLQEVIDPFAVLMINHVICKYKTG